MTKIRIFIQIQIWACIDRLVISRIMSKTTINQAENICQHTGRVHCDIIFSMNATPLMYPSCNKHSRCVSVCRRVSAVWFTPPPLSFVFRSVTGCIPTSRDREETVPASGITRFDTHTHRMPASCPPCNNAMVIFVSLDGFVRDSCFQF